MFSRFSPILNHINQKDFQFVYEPSEDSFLLCEGIEKNINFIKEEIKPTICLEIGTGTGFVTCFVNKLFEENKVSCFYITTDINHKAAKIANETFKLNCVEPKETIITDLIEGFESRLKNSIDLLLFNPPYVPTDPSEKIGIDPLDQNSLLSSSWAGGKNGMEVTQIVLDKLDFLLSPNGCCFIVALEENQPEIIAKNLFFKGFRTAVVKKKEIEDEKLYILKIYRK
ncbi:methyltransferase n6amt1 [Anaeramoeba ignava]|uniref:Methyltransferase n6amt1 n=1 Tax=Anaeramoeba ignava TaxID=1746090 RepID=A0A9Q0LJL7_ANAIG|nr:methyltransferase n6amt1 [Anaeramoeba ignava]